jgi:hypothetical protein
MSENQIFVQIILILHCLSGDVLSANASPAQIPQKESWVSYRLQGDIISFRYPADLVSLKEREDGIFLSHSVPFVHENPCDFGAGPEITYTEFGDFAVSIEFDDRTIEEILADSWLGPMVQGNTMECTSGVDSVQYGNLRGYCIHQGFEGCGKRQYYFPLDSGVISIVRNIITYYESAPRELIDKLYEIPGVITAESEEKLFVEIVETIEVNPKSPN